jgi:nicotinamide-nucleotide amidase
MIGHADMRTSPFFPASLTDPAARLLAACRDRGLRLALAESCTGGLIAAALTAVAGSSDVVDRGFVTYSNQAKTDMLGIPAALIAAQGAVSEPVALAMVEGALHRSEADIAIAVTGIAGPGGGGPDKPVGLVHFASARRNRPTCPFHAVFPGDRDAVRLAAALAALDMLLARATEDATSDVSR